MAVSLKHTTQTATPDSADGKISHDAWNEEHTLTLATDKLLGRTTAGTGAVEELTCTDFIQTLLDDPDATTARATLGVSAGSQTPWTSDIDSDGFDLQMTGSGSTITATADGTNYGEYRKALGANLNLYVKTPGSGGSDSNDGLTSGTAFATLTKAVETALALDWSSTFGVTINVGTGTFDGVSIYANSIPHGQGELHIAGNGTANTIIDPTANFGIGFYAQGPIVVVVSNLTTDGTNYGGGCFHYYCFNGAQLNGSGVRLFGLDGDYGFVCSFRGYSTSVGCEFDGDFAYGLWTEADATCIMSTYTLTGTPNFSASFAYGQSAGELLSYNPTGSATGVKFELHSAARILNFASSFPGDVDGIYVDGYDQDGVYHAENIINESATGNVIGTVDGVNFAPYRKALGADLTIYVRTGGIDTDDGLTSGSAFLTLQHALDVALGYDWATFGVTIDVGAGTFAGAYVKARGATFSATTTFLRIRGAGVGTTIIDTAPSGYGLFFSGIVPVIIGLVTIDGTNYGGGSYHCGGDDGAIILVGGDIGSVKLIGVTGDYGLLSFYGEQTLTAWTSASTLTLQGDFAAILYASLASYNYMQGGTLAVSGTVTVSDGFAVCDTGGHNQMFSDYSATAVSGPKFSVTTDARVTDSTNLPGDVAGTVLTGYVDGIYYAVSPVLKTAPRITDVLLFDEIADPANAPANSAYFFAKDNGSGKTQICVKFPSGSTQVIATEP